MADVDRHLSLDFVLCEWSAYRNSLLLCIAMVTLAVIVLLQSLQETDDAKVPTVKFYDRLVPSIFSRLKFNSSASTVIYEGYKKVFEDIRGEERS